MPLDPEYVQRVEVAMARPEVVKFGTRNRIPILLAAMIIDTTTTIENADALIEKLRQEGKVPRPATQAR